MIGISFDLDFYFNAAMFHYWIYMILILIYTPALPTKPSQEVSPIIYVKNISVSFIAT